MSEAFPENELHGCFTKWTDPDFRPRPKTDRHCLMCGKDLRQDRRARLVRCFHDTYSAIHPIHYEKAQASGIKVETWFLGPDCARLLGLEWSTEEWTLPGSAG